MTDGLIYHLAEPKVWAASTDEYVCASLEEEGFIHCSTADQVSRTARRFFTDRNTLVLLAIDPEPLGDLVVFEDLYGMGEEFPHIYGPLPTAAVGNTAPYLTHLEEGLWAGGHEVRPDMDGSSPPSRLQRGRDVGTNVYPG